MGRGRAKAKQQKVARELKYNSHHTDLDALQRELRGSSAPATDTYDRDDGPGYASTDFGDADDDDDSDDSDDDSDSDGENDPDRAY